jgi:hypothetical protein
MHAFFRAAAHTVNKRLREKPQPGAAGRQLGSPHRGHFELTSRDGSADEYGRYLDRGVGVTQGTGQMYGCHA